MLFITVNKIIDYARRCIELSENPCISRHNAINMKARAELTISLLAQIELEKHSYSNLRDTILVYNQIREKYEKLVYQK